MSSLRLPVLADLSRKQYENQFSRPPSDPIFSDKKKVFFFTGLEAPGNWTLSYMTPSREQDMRQGRGSVLWFHPVVALELSNQTGIQQLYGFFVQTE